MDAPHTLRTLAAPAEAQFKDKGSRFLAFAYPARTADEVKTLLEALKKEHFKAVHHCYAYRFGTSGTEFRANDDGEPSGSAGRPILGQIDSFALTDTAVIVVRYFGGVLLGVPGLIHAYKTAARDALAAAQIIEKPVTRCLKVVCNYPQLNEVLRIFRQHGADAVEHDLQLKCTLCAAVPLAFYSGCLKTLQQNHLIEIIEKT